MSHSSFITIPTSAPFRAMQFVWLRLQGAPSRADQRRWFKGFQRAMLERGLVSTRWRSFVCLCPIGRDMTSHDRHQVIDWLVDQPEVRLIELFAVVQMPVAGFADVERYARNRTDRPPAGTPAAHLYGLWLRLVCVLTRLAQQVAANSARLAGHAAFTTPVLPLTLTASGSAHDTR